jgi:hypothetical protein
MEVKKELVYLNKLVTFQGRALLLTMLNVNASEYFDVVN